MYYCSDYATAVMLCVVTMLCWGSWGNTQKLAGKTWRFELFYWDYVLGLVIFALLGHHRSLFYFSLLLILLSSAGKEIVLL